MDETCLLNQIEKSNGEAKKDTERRERKIQLKLTAEFSDKRNENFIFKVFAALSRKRLFKFRCHLSN